MSDQLFERAVRDWLEDGSDRTPRPAIDAVLLAVKTTRQERDLRIPRRFTQMPTYMRLAAGIAIVPMHGLTLTTLPRGATVRPLTERPAGSRTIEALAPAEARTPVVDELIERLTDAARIYAVRAGSSESHRQIREAETKTSQIRCRRLQPVASGTAW